MANKLKRKNRPYLDDIRKNEQGNYVYEGRCYVWNLTGKSRGPALMSLWIPALAMILAQAAGGFLPAPGLGDCFYLILPYTAGLISGISVVWALGKFSAAGGRVREYVYQAVKGQVPFRTALTAICAVLSAAGEAVYILRHGTDGSAPYAVLFLILEAVVFGAALCIRAVFAHIKWEQAG